MSATPKQPTATDSRGAHSLHRWVGKQTAMDKSVRDLPVKAKLKNGQIIAEQGICGVVFSFPASAWPASDATQQLNWIMRLTPWWDIGEKDWTPQAQRLRESCRKSINKLLQGAVCLGNREHPAGDGMNVTRRPLLPNTELSSGGTADNRQLTEQAARRLLK